MPKIITNPEQLILSVAREIISEEGYKAMNVRAISKRSGVSIGTIYNYFPDKASLDYRVMDYFWMGYEEKIKVILENNDPILSQIRACYDVLMEHLGQFLTLFSIRSSAKSRERYCDPNKQALLNRAGQLMAIRLKETCVFDEDLSAEEMANFIINTHVQIASYQIYEYSIFEKILQKSLVIKSVY